MSLVGVDILDGETVDKMIKRFKKKYEKSGVLKEFRQRTFYTKPSIERKTKEARSVRKVKRVSDERNS